MKGRSQAIDAFERHEEALIRHIDRKRKGARKPDEKKPPQSRRIERVVMVIALNGLHDSSHTLTVRPYELSEEPEPDG